MAATYDITGIGENDIIHNVGKNTFLGKIKYKRITKRKPANSKCSSSYKNRQVI